MSEVQSCTGMIKFMCTPEISKEITGNGVGGDDRIVWDKRFPETIKEAREMFNKLLEKGYKAFMIRKDGQKSERQMFRFDPNAEEVLMIPQVMGG